MILNVERRRRVAGGGEGSTNADVMHREVNSCQASHLYIQTTDHEYR